MSNKILQKMKNLLFGLLAIFSFLLNGNAQEKSDINQKIDFKSASLITTYEKEVTEYKFLSLAELNEEVDQIIQELDSSHSENTKHNSCEVTIEIKIEVAFGETKGLVSGVIISNCIESNVATKRLKAMLLAATMG